MGHGIDALSEGLEAVNVAVAATSHAGQLQQGLIGLPPATDPRVPEREHIQTLVEPEHLLEQVVTSQKAIDHSGLLGLKQRDALVGHLGARSE